MLRTFSLVASTLVLAGLLAGCTERTKTVKNDKKPAPEKKVHDHGGWWCSEHGVPEHECSLCLPEDEVKKRFKDTGDWCKIHDRAQSQCFKCDPEKYKTFEAKYVAKFNEKPERPPEEEFKK